MMMVGVAIGAAAADRLYIEDFELAAGESRTVSILLENEAEYTAFQTDIYLPEGLTVEQDDWGYVFELTSRKGRDHVISSRVQMDGAIRVMSYSIDVNAYNGNSGALVTFNVTAASDFSGPATIGLRNTLVSTPSGVEIPLSDEECTVTVPGAGRSGDVTGDGTIDIEDVTMLISLVLGNNVPDAVLANANVNGDGTIDIEDVTMLISMVLGTYGVRS